MLIWYVYFYSFQRPAARTSSLPVSQFTRTQFYCGKSCRKAKGRVAHNELRSVFATADRVISDEVLPTDTESQSHSDELATVEAVIGDKGPGPAMHTDDSPTVDAVIGDAGDPQLWTSIPRSQLRDHSISKLSIFGKQRWWDCFSLKQHSKYFCQLQGQLYVTSRLICRLCRGKSYVSLVSKPSSSTVQDNAQDGKSSWHRMGNEEDGVV